MRTVSRARHRAVRKGLVLAAGNGDRFHNANRQSKLLQPVLGRPLILRTLQTARDAGVASFEVVLGLPGALRALIERDDPDDVEVRFSFNPDWHLENGVSVLSARHRFVDSRFALSMGDHLFEASVLTRLLEADVDCDESVLAVDSRPAPPAVEAEATRVRTVDSQIVAIGKNLQTCNALDTGLFVCAPALFAALDVSTASRDTTLSGGIRQLAVRGLVRTFEIGDASWYDIDHCGSAGGGITAHHPRTRPTLFYFPRDAAVAVEPCARLAGLPIAERVLRAALRAGYTRIIVWAPDVSSAVRAREKRLKRLARAIGGNITVAMTEPEWQTTIAPLNETTPSRQSAPAPWSRPRCCRPRAH